MDLLVSVAPMCVFDLVHTSRLAEANFLAWAGGITVGLLASGYLTIRNR